MTAYYNEIDSFAAAWLRELITAGLIAPGEVDERSIEDVKPDDLLGFTQCHFFAGIGVWSYALRRAGWPDNTPVWTGSCPCQSFSASGKGEGFSDKRHLWPAWFRLIKECRPDVIFGEQVASKNGLAWLDVVSADLEGKGYAVGASDICAAGVGAPHIRQRLYFVADASSPRRAGSWQYDGGPSSLPARPEQCGEVGELGDTEGRGFGMRGSAPGGSRRAAPPSESCQLGKPESERCADDFAGSRGAQEPIESSGVANGAVDHAISNGRRESGNHDRGDERIISNAASGTNGFWRDAEWIWCRDEKYRPVSRATQSDVEQMVAGIAHQLGLVRFTGYPPSENAETLIFAPLIAKGKSRAGRLRGYGNALNAEAAIAFIEAYRELSHAEVD